MNTLTRLVISLSLTGFSTTLPITVIAATTEQVPAKVTTVKQHPSFLFVLRAETGTISKTDEGYTLTLQGMDEKVLYFSDRPVRKAGFITTTQFISDWAKGKNNFQANPPNAAIVHAALETNSKGIAQAIPIELTNPIATTNGWTFQLKDLEGKISIGSYNRISVFVDGESVNTWWCSHIGGVWC